MGGLQAEASTSDTPPGSASGQPATARITRIMGATNSQAARVRCRVSREARPAAGAATPAGTATLPAATGRYQRPPRDRRSSFFSRAARLVGAEMVTSIGQPARTVFSTSS